jgi:hypothetical protein
MRYTVRETHAERDTQRRYSEARTTAGAPITMRDTVRETHTERDTHAQREIQ